MQVELDAAVQRVADNSRGGIDLEVASSREAARLSSAARLEAARIMLRDAADHLVRLRAQSVERSTERRPAGGTDAKHRRTCKGCPACDEWAQTCAAIDAQLNAQWDAELATAIDHFKAQLRVEWTAELLATHFAVGDGERVTWGEAGEDQHQQRRDMLIGNAAGNMEAATRHAVAIDLLKETGASCLNEALAATGRREP